MPSGRRLERLFEVFRARRHEVSVPRLLAMLLAWLRALLGTSDPPPDGDALDDDVLDAWLDEDEIDASGL